MRKCPICNEKSGSRAHQCGNCGYWFIRLRKPIDELFPYTRDSLRGVTAARSICGVQSHERWCLSCMYKLTYGDLVNWDAQGELYEQTKAMVIHCFGCKNSDLEGSVPTKYVEDQGDLRKPMAEEFESPFIFPPRAPKLPFKVKEPDPKKKGVLFYKGRSSDPIETEWGTADQVEWRLKDGWNFVLEP